MSGIRLNTDGDVDVTGGRLSLVTGLEGIAQNLRIRLQMFQGEWFLDTRVGVPYFQSVFTGRLRQPLVEIIFKKTIRETPGVTELLTFALTFVGSTRTLSLAFTARTTSGEILKFDQPFIVNGDLT